MNLLRGVCGIRIDRVRNEVARNLCGGEESLDGRVKKSLPRWYGHVKIDKAIAAKMVCGRVN